MSPSFSTEMIECDKVLLCTLHMDMGNASLIVRGLVPYLGETKLAWTFF